MKKMSDLFSEYFDRYDNYRGKLFSQNDMQLISPKQFYYMEAIKKLKGPTAGELAEHFSVSRPAVTKIIDKLEDMGYVSRVVSKIDKRSFSVKLTKEGRELSKLNINASEFISSEIEGRLSIDEAKELRRLLDKGLR